MSEYRDQNDKKGHKENLIERSFSSLFGYTSRTDAEEILSEDLDHPDWHLKYARNIINLIVFFGLVISLDELIFRGEFSSRSFLSESQAVLLFVVSAIIGLVCGFFDNRLDQESTEVRWFNYARFWFVLLTVGSLTLYIGIMAIGTILSL
jgi:hypothetical protein